MADAPLALFSHSESLPVCAAPHAGRRGSSGALVEQRTALAGPVLPSRLVAVQMAQGTDPAHDPTYAGYEAPTLDGTAGEDGYDVCDPPLIHTGPTSATPAAEGHQHPQRCTCPSPNGGTCTTMAVNGGHFCSRHSCPKCGASKSSAAGGCLAHGGVNTEA